MDIQVWNIGISIIVLLCLPIMVGNEVCGLLGHERTLAKSYVIGLISIWGACQLIAVPVILLKGSFWIIVIILSVCILTACLDSIIHKRYVKLTISGMKRSERIALILVWILIVALLIATTVLQHTDADDSRFVVNAVDICRTNTMFLTNPATGETLTTWVSELRKDVSSPWAVMIAYYARVTGTYATIMAHTCMPIMLILGVLAVYWLLSDEFFHNQLIYRCLFLFFVILLNVYGNYSRRSAETFMMTRIWQGKAVVASMGVPLLILLLLWIYKEDKGWKNYILLIVSEFALCLLSGMGIIIGAMQVGCFGIVYGIAKKDWKVLLKIWATMLPNIICFVIYQNPFDWGFL